MMTRSLFLALFAILFFSLSIAQPQVNGAAQQVQQGDMALKLGDWDKAIIHYTNAVSADPQNADAFMKRAKVLAKLGRNNESLDDYNRAIAINPNSAIFYDLRAKMKIIALDFPGARADMSKALSVSPKDQGIQESMIDNHLRMGNYRSALVLADSILTN